MSWISGIYIKQKEDLYNVTYIRYNDSKRCNWKMQIILTILHEQMAEKNIANDQPRAREDRKLWRCKIGHLLKYVEYDRKKNEMSLININFSFVLKKVKLRATVLSRLLTISNGRFSFHTEGSIKLCLHNPEQTEIDINLIMKDFS